MLPPGDSLKVMATSKEYPGETELLIEIAPLTSKTFPSLWPTVANASIAAGKRCVVAAVQVNQDMVGRDPSREDNTG
jgi:hypothetical protein